jgi:hypothetical protein
MNDYTASSRFLLSVEWGRAWSMSLHYCERFVLSNISTSAPQPCLKEMIMKIADLLLSSAALLAVSSAAFADARNNVINGPTAHSNIEVPYQTAIGSTATEDSLCLLPVDLSQWQAIPIGVGKR